MREKARKMVFFLGIRMPVLSFAVFLLRQDTCNGTKSFFLNLVSSKSR